MKGVTMTKPKRKGPRFRGWLLHFVTAFGLTSSVLAGFGLGCLIGQQYGGEPYTGIIGALLGFAVGLSGLILIAAGESKGGK